MEQVVLKNSQLVKLNLEHNSISVTLMKVIKKAVADNVESQRYDYAGYAYYLQVEERQEAEKEQLARTIEDLRMREQELSYNALLAETARREEQVSQAEKSVEVERE